MKYRLSSPKRSVVVKLDPAEDLLEGMEKAIEEAGIKSGWVNAIGGLRKATYGIYEMGGHRQIEKSTENCFELLSAFGNITLKEDKIFVHAHLIFADDEGRTHGGHLLKGCEIFPLAEIVLQETDANLHRVFDSQTGLWPISIETSK